MTILCQPDGTVQYLYNGDDQTDTKLTGKKVGERTLQKVIQNKRYSGTDDLGCMTRPNSWWGCRCTYRTDILWAARCS